MRFINPSHKNSQIQNEEIENVINLRHGVTRRLLEKYKSKGLYSNESMSDIDDKNRVA